MSYAGWLELACPDAGVVRAGRHARPYTGFTVALMDSYHHPRVLRQSRPKRLASGGGTCEYSYRKQLAVFLVRVGH